MKQRTASGEMRARTVGGARPEGREAFLVFFRDPSFDAHEDERFRSMPELIDEYKKSAFYITARKSQLRRELEETVGKQRRLNLQNRIARLEEIECETYRTYHYIKREYGGRGGRQGGEEDGGT